MIVVFALLGGGRDMGAATTLFNRTTITFEVELSTLFFEKGQ